MIIISQPRYLPSMHYLQRLRFADTFVLLDNVQRQARGWENRNKILFSGKPQWLSIPIRSSSREVICKTEICDFCWIDNHIKQIVAAYKRCKFFDIGFVEDYFSVETRSNSFVDVVEQMLLNIGTICEFSPNVKRSSHLLKTQDKFCGPKFLLKICKELGGNLYVSGSNGRAYGVDDAFSGSGILVKFHQHDMQEYQQENNDGEFVPYMSFFDFLFNEGLGNLKSFISHEMVLI